MGDHLINMARGGSPKEKGGAGDCGRAKAEVATKREDSHHAETEAGETDLVLKGAIGPADERCRHVRKEDVHDEIIDKAQADGEKAVVGEEGFEGGRPG